MSEIYLTDQQCRVAYDVAHARMEAAPVREAAGEQRGTYDRLGVEVVGVRAEMAAAAYYGVEPNLEVHGDRRVEEPDLVINGAAVNVKGTIYPRQSRPSLFVPAHNSPVELYMLVHARTDRMLCEVLGWATRETLQRHDPRVHYQGAPPSYKLRYDELFAADVLKLMGHTSQAEIGRR